MPTCQALSGQASAFSARRRSASERPTSCCSAHASIFAVSAGGIRTATSGVRPLDGGRYGLRLVDFLAILQSALPSVIPAELSCQRQGKADPGPIPANRMKADRPHRVPLSDAAVEILTALKSDSTPAKRDYIFAVPTGRPLSEKALRRACHRINPAISVHGMRSTFRDWVGDNTKFPVSLPNLPLRTLSKARRKPPTGAPTP